MTTKERNRCWKGLITSIRTWMQKWQHEEGRLISMIDYSYVQISHANEELEKVDKNNPKALRTATSTLDIAQKNVARLEEELAAIRAKIAKGDAEERQYRTRIVDNNLIKE